MRSSTLTSKGQVTLPKEIREFLKVKSGDIIDFVIDSEGNVMVRAGNVHVGELKGLLHQPGRRPISLKKMEQSVLERHGKRP